MDRPTFHFSVKIDKFVILTKNGIILAKSLLLLVAITAYVQTGEHFMNIFWEIQLCWTEAESRDIFEVVPPAQLPETAALS